MNRFLIGAAISFAACSALVAAGPQSNVSTEVLEALLARGEDMPTIHPGSLPESFGDRLPIKKPLRVVASAEHRDHSQIVLASSAKTSDARNQVIGVLETAGWKRAHEEQNEEGGGGFVDTQRRMRPDYFCGADDQALNMTARRRGEETFVTLYIYKNADAYGCSGSPRERGSGSALVKWLPRLTPPAESVAMMGGTGASGMGNDIGSSVFTSATVRSALTIGDVVQHFTPQLIEAGWELDSQSLGSRTSSQQWTREAGANRLVGTLSAFQKRKKELGVEFKITLVEK